MGRLMIKRGHDGPARRCTWKTGNLTIDTPSLLGPPDMPDIDTVYATFTRDEIHESRPTVLVAPSLIERPALTLPENALLVIAPTLAGIDTLDRSVARQVLDVQVSRISSSGTDGEHFALHVPSSTDPQDLRDVVALSADLGVRAAVFHFDGSLGMPDLNAVLLRQELPCDWLSVAVGRIDPALVPVLYYLGFDVFDISRAEEASSRSQRLWRMGPEKIESIDAARFCACHACRNASEDSLVLAILRHNVDQYHLLLSEALYNSRRGLLRWFVESLSHVSPALAAFLRRVDTAAYDKIEEFTPTTGSGVVPLIGPESYDSPLVKRFRDRLVERYTPPPNKSIVLLLPCSARKPYSDSRSHRRFIETIESSVGSGRRGIAETIITSPLGIIPRELERIYPVANYDLPVTGDWDAEEIQIASDALVSHMKKYPSSVVVVAHVTGGYAEVVRAAEDEIEQSVIYTTREGSATSRDALQALTEVLQDMSELTQLKGGRPTLLEETLRATADFQFGQGAGELLIPQGSRLSGKLYRTVICRVDKEQTCAFIADSGLLSLTLEGAKRLAPLKQYWVKFDGVEIKGGSLFSVAVQSADPQIRPGDEVIILNREDEVVGVGRSEMSGREMCEFTNGRAVTIRHRRK